MNPTYSGTSNTDRARAEEAAVAKAQGQVQPVYANNAPVPVITQPAPIIQTTTERRNLTQERSNNLDTRLTGGASSVAATQNPTGGNGGISVNTNTAPTAPMPGQTVGVDGKPIPQGSQVTDPQSYAAKYDAQFGTGSYARESQQKEEAKAKIAEYDTQLAGLKASQNASTNALIDSVRAIYGARIQKMEDANHRLLETKRTAGFKNATNRYAPILNQGILTSEEQAGHARIGELEGAMMQAIAQAEKARSDGNLKMFNDRYSFVEQVESKLQTEIMNQFQRVRETDAARRADETLALNRTKEENDRKAKMAEQAAPAIAKALEKYSNDADKLKFLEAYSKKTGIDVDVIRGEAEKAGATIRKNALDEVNIRNTISSRNRGDSLAETKFSTEQEEKSNKAAVTRTILNNLSAKKIDINKAREYWASEGLTQKDFDDEFKSFMEGI